MWIGQVFLFYIPLLDPLWGSACLARLYLFFITSNWGSNQLWDNPPYYPLSCDPYVQATKVDIDKERKQKRLTKKNKSRGDFLKARAVLKKELDGVMQTVIDSHGYVDDSALFRPTLIHDNLWLFCTSGSADSPVISRATTLQLIDW